MLRPAMQEANDMTLERSFLGTQRYELSLEFVFANIASRLDS